MAMGMGKGKGLSIAVLLGKGKPSSSDEGSPESKDGMMEETEGELPPGLLEAVSEFRSATTDEEAAKALKAAIGCCE
jgi:hypothetical protein